MSSTRILLAAVVILLGLRWVALDIDAPHGIVTHSGVFDGDEGWYTKAAQLQARFGVWTQPKDLTPFTHNPVHAFVLWLLFEAFGIGLNVARGLSVAASLLSMAFLYGIARSVWPRPQALVTVLVAAVTLHNVAYGRLALLEPLGACFALGALWVWIRGEGRVGPTAAALGLAALAVGVKLTFVAAFGAMGTLVVIDAWRARDAGWVEVTGRLALIAAGVAALLASHALIRAAWPEAWAGYQRVVLGPRTAGTSVAEIIGHEVSVWSYALPRSSGGRVLWFVGMLGAVVIVMRDWRLVDPRRWSRPVLAMMIWLIAWVSVVGVAKYQAPRYFYPVIFPMAFLAVAVVSSQAPARWRLPATMGLLLVHAIAQVPGYYDWLSREDNFSNARMATDVASTINARDGEAVVIMGHRAAFVSLFAEHARPVELGFVDAAEYSLGERVDAWAPRYLLESPHGLATLREARPALQPELVRKFRVMASATLLYRLR